MPELLKFSLALLISFFIGSIPTGYMMGYLLKKIDVREHGSGNAGATNVLRVIGIKAGVSVLLIDALKAAGSLIICKTILIGTGFDFQLLAVFGISTILGNVFTPFLGFKGGKGVATSCGVFAYLTPLPFLAALVTWIITVALTKYVSLGSILAVIFLFLSQLALMLYTQSSAFAVTGLCLVAAIFIIIKHRQNIKRLRAGTENKLSLAGKRSK